MRNPTRERPAQITVQGRGYAVAPWGRLWFFQLQGHDEAGWTCCCEGFVKLIEQQLGLTAPKSTFEDSGPWDPAGYFGLPDVY